MEESFHQTLICFGVSESAIKILVEEELETEVAVRRAVATGTHIPGVRAGSMAILREKFGTPSTANGIVVKLDRGPKSIGDMTDRDELLGVLTSDREIADKRAAASKLSQMGFRVVTEKDNKTKIRPDDTKAAWKAKFSGRFWGRDNLPFIEATNLFMEPDEMVEVDPYELAKNGRKIVLVDGFNSVTGADWSGVSMVRRALVMVAADESSELLNANPVDIAEALSITILKGGWKVLGSRVEFEQREASMLRLKVKLSQVSEGITVAIPTRHSCQKLIRNLDGWLNDGRQSAGFTAAFIREIGVDPRKYLPDPTTLSPTTDPYFYDDESIYNLVVAVARIGALDKVCLMVAVAVL